MLLLSLSQDIPVKENILISWRLIILVGLSFLGDAMQG